MYKKNQNSISWVVFVISILVAGMIAFFVFYKGFFASFVGRTKPSLNVSTTNNAVVPSAKPSTPSTIGLFSVFELTRIFVAAGLTNPWEQASFSGVFTAPSGKKFSIDGFFYTTNTWKLRFAPNEVGQWQWSTRLTSEETTGAKTESGSFTVTPASSPGFLRINKDNPSRFVFDNGKLFNGIGLGECMNDVDADGDPFNQMAVDGGMRPEGQEAMPNDAQFPGLEGYFSLYGPAGAGFNLYRWSVDNCAFKLWDTISPAGNTYLTREGKWGDDLVQTLQKNNIRVWMTIFGFNPPFPETAGTSTAQQEAIKRYIRYVVARYGAYVDVWELMNEAVAKDPWYTFAGTYLRSIDPYRHPITTSWEKPELSVIDITAPHWYQLESEFESDKVTVLRIQGARTHDMKKPVVFGEQGNSVQNWDSRSGVRLRLRSWSAFFNEGILIFWNTSGFKNYRSPVAANVYIGPEEREYVRALQTFTANADPLLRLTTIQTSQTSSVRGYALTSPTSFLGYLTNFKDHVSPTSGVTVSFVSPVNGVVTWIDPSTGQAVGGAPTPVSVGTTTLQVPDFVTDIALRLAK